MAEAAAASTPAAAAAPAAPAPAASTETKTEAKSEAKPAPAVAIEASKEIEAKPQVETPKPVPTEEERRAQRIAAARREAARVAAERENIAREKAAHAQDLRLASEYRRLAELQKKDPLAYLEEVGLKVGEISKLYLQKSQGKTPEQIAEDVYQRREAERAKAAEAEALRTREAEAIRQREAAYAGAKNTLATIIKGDAERFKMCCRMTANGLGDVPVDKAFKLIEDYHRETKQILDFGKALDAVETQFRALDTQAEVVKPAVKAEAKAASGRKSATGTSAAADVSEVETPKPSTLKPLNRRMTPREQRQIARELVQAAKAAQDT